MIEVIHIKSGKTYYVSEHFGPIYDATNNHDGNLMILYHNEDGQYYVREKNEFWRKFRPLDPISF